MRLLIVNNYSEVTSSKNPQYTLANIMLLLDQKVLADRNLIKRAGIEIDELKSDPSEIIRYEDYRLLWISLANRCEGKLLSTLLVEEKSHNWFSNLFGRRR